ncbi:MAG: NAD(P)-dependent glycerol-3-phosphate dehydrogenase [Treponema sp.]|jgi:glycerol-3-phosphate dehydrogenase (NAD(P)+)|nr:NAD(P)-dependent glycerol-3-phosphate dehydrogenase [Treponema sp.]
MHSSIAVLGAGAWGTAIAKVIADKGKEVSLWSRGAALAEAINTRHLNAPYLPDLVLPPNIRASTDIIEVASDKEFLILAIPSLYLIETVKKILLVPSIREGETAIAVLTKGFLPSSKGPRLILETLEDYLPGFYQHALVYIAGPSHAEEVVQKKITGLIAASENAKNSIRFRDLLRSRQLMVFSSFDIRGVQVSAAAKNVIAIAFGILEALKLGTARAPELERQGIRFGDGTESLLLAAGLNEIQTLGRAMGATHAETFTSISGVGDLDVTCRSVFGRNRRFGREIIEKQILSPFANLEELLKRIHEIGYLPEGVAAAKYVKILAEKLKLKMPICTGLYRILNREIEVPELLEAVLQGLAPKSPPGGLKPMTGSGD